MRSPPLVYPRARYALPPVRANDHLTVLNVAGRAGDMRVQLTNQIIYNRDPVTVLMEEDKTVRTTLNIEIRYDTKLNDDQRREAFLDLALAKAQELYGVVAMLAENDPTLKPPSASVVTVGSEGRKVHPLFQLEEQN